MESENVSRSVVSDPLQPHGLYVVHHGVLQARILEWVASPFSRESSQPRDQTWVSCITGRFFTVWATSALNFFFFNSIFRNFRFLNNLFVSEYAVFLCYRYAFDPWTMQRLGLELRVSQKPACSCWRPSVFEVLHPHIQPTTDEHHTIILHPRGSKASYSLVLWED